MSRTQTHEWYKHFKEGQSSMKDSEQSEQLSISEYEENVQKVRKVICSSCHLTDCEVAEEVQISKTMWHEILTENLGMHGVAAKFVLCLLSEDSNKIMLMSAKSLLTV
jgi:hypothetical protein